MKVEFCMNSEYIAGGEAPDGWQDEYAGQYLDAAMRALEKDPRADFEPERTSGQRVLFHGWNGAHFDYRSGIFGVWGRPTEEQKAALDDANEVGRQAAKQWAAELEETE